MAGGAGVVKTYAAKEVTISCDNHLCTGLADDSFVSIEPGGDGITYKYGCDGEIARAVSPNNTYVVKITVLQPSDSNTFFQGKFNQDQATGDAIFPIMIKDLRNGLVLQAAQAWVTKPAARVRGKETNNNEWVIQTGEATLNEELWS